MKAIFALCHVAAAFATKPPHIIFIVADDLGFADLGYKGSEIKTPAIDSIAEQGRTLTNYYVQSSCSPSRAAFHTGRYPARYNIDVAMAGMAPRGVPLNETFLPEVLQRRGYRTHAVGKWHLGQHAWEFTPAFRGYESYVGYLGGGESYFTHLIPWFFPGVITNHIPKVPAESYDFWRQTKQNCGADCLEALPNAYNYYSTHYFTEEAVRVIEKHDPEEPFFLYLAYQAVHGPVEVPRSYMAPYDFITDKKRHIYAGMLAALDEGIGNVTKALKERGMWEDTLVVFTSDNGGPTETCETNGSQNKGLKAGKCSLHEGGVRVESFVGGPALPASVAGKPMTRLMHGVDWLPTLAELAGLNVSDSLTKLPLDGVSHWSNLKGEADEEVHQEIFYGYNAGFPKQREGTAIRNSRWKLIRGADGFVAPLRRIPGSDGWCTPNCVNCSASKGYAPDLLHQLNHECPRDIQTGAASSRRLTEGKKADQIQLYDLLNDVAETTDVSLEEPEIVKELAARLDAWETETYLAPGDDPAATPGCPSMPAKPNHDGPNRAPIQLPWCKVPGGATLV